MLGMVVFWGAIIALVVWLLRGGAASRSEPPQEILRRRLLGLRVATERAARLRQGRAGADDEGLARVGAGALP